MTAAVVPMPRRAPNLTAAMTALLLWAASFVALGVIDGEVPYFALMVAGYAIYLGAVGAWPLPKAVSSESDDVLRATATGPRLAARWVVVLGSVALVAAYGSAWAGIEGGYTVPLLTPLIQWLLTIHF